MTFRKDPFLFYESIVCFSILILLFLLAIPIVGPKISWPIIILYVIFIIVNPKLFNEWITIDETGIACKKSETQLWGYSWEEIAILKKSCRYNWPSIEVILYDKSGEEEPYGTHDHYFQLGKTAKKALKQYCRSSQDLQYH